MIKKILSAAVLLTVLSLTACKKIPVLPGKDPEVEAPGPETPSAQYYIKYKINGVAFSMAEVSATRETTTTPRTLTISGSAKSGAKPLFKFYCQESYIGFVRGLNILSNQNSPESNYIQYTNGAGKLFATENDADGIWLFIGEASYIAGGNIKGSFSGTAKTANGEVVELTDGEYNVKFTN